MKKLLLATLVAGLMSTSALALDGTITKISITSSGVTKIIITTSTGSSTKKTIGDISSDAGKAMLAIALTAKSAGDPVEAYHDGTSWTALSVSLNP